jgi:hypothetical protein
VPPLWAFAGAEGSGSGRDHGPCASLVLALASGVPEGRLIVAEAGEQLPACPEERHRPMEGRPFHWRSIATSDEITQDNWSASTGKEGAIHGDRSQMSATRSTILHEARARAAMQVV